MDKFIYTIIGSKYPARWNITQRDIDVFKEIGGKKVLIIEPNDNPPLPDIKPFIIDEIDLAKFNMGNKPYLMPMLTFDDYSKFMDKLTKDKKKKNGNRN